MEDKTSISHTAELIKSNNINPVIFPLKTRTEILRENAQAIDVALPLFTEMQIKFFALLPSFNEIICKIDNPNTRYLPTM